MEEQKKEKNTLSRMIQTELVARCKTNHLNLSDLAYLLKTTPTVVSFYKGGRTLPSAARIYDMAEVLEWPELVHVAPLYLTGTSTRPTTPLTHYLHRQLRKKRWTVIDLSREAECNVVALRRLFRGETRLPHARTMRRLEDALELEEGTLRAVFNGELTC